MSMVDDKIFRSYSSTNKRDLHRESSSTKNIFQELIVTRIMSSTFSLFENFFPLTSPVAQRVQDAHLMRAGLCIETIIAHRAGQVDVR
ncbi:MAG: hypothetical protein ACO398_04850 [Kiritimatiellia bacterium]|jgi:hypothetical protein